MAFADERPIDQIAFLYWGLSRLQFEIDASIAPNWHFIIIELPFIADFPPWGAVRTLGQKTLAQPLGFYFLQYFGV